MKESKMPAPIAWLGGLCMGLLAGYVVGMHYGRVMAHHDTCRELGGEARVIQGECHRRVRGPDGLTVGWELAR